MSNRSDEIFRAVKETDKPTGSNGIFVQVRDITNVCGELYRGCDIYVGNNGSRSLKIIGHRRRTARGIMGCRYGEEVGCCRQKEDSEGYHGL